MATAAYELIAGPLLLERRLAMHGEARELFVGRAVAPDELDPSLCLADELAARRPP